MVRWEVLMGLWWHPVHKTRSHHRPLQTYRFTAAMSRCTLRGVAFLLLVTFWHRVDLLEGLVRRMRMARSSCLLTVLTDLSMCKGSTLQAPDLLATVAADCRE